MRLTDASARNGGSDVKISGSSLTATKNDVAVTANDSSSTSIEAVGISGGAVALGVIVAQAENTSNIGITVDKSSLKAEKTSILAPNAKPEMQMVRKKIIPCR